MELDHYSWSLLYLRNLDTQASLVSFPIIELTNTNQLTCFHLISAAIAMATNGGYVGGGGGGKGGEGLPGDEISMLPFPWEPLM